MIDTAVSERYTKFLRIFGGFFSLIGGIFLAGGIVMCILNITIAYAKETPVFLILGINFSLTGGVFAIIGGTFLFIVYKEKKKISRLMTEGKCYEAKITNMYFNFTMRLNRRYPLICECVYDSNGKNYLVKSGNVWIDGLYKNTLNLFDGFRKVPEFTVKEEDIKANVWVNPKNPKDYFVDVYVDKAKTAEENDIKIDYDYR